MMLDAMRTQEDPLQRQRLLVEEERLKYLNQEELLIQQLQWVQSLVHLWWTTDIQIETSFRCLMFHLEYYFIYLF